MSDLFGLEFWAKKDLMAEIKRLKEESELRGAENMTLRNAAVDLTEQVERLKADLASVQTVKPEV